MHNERDAVEVVLACEYAEDDQSYALCWQNGWAITAFPSGRVVVTKSPRDDANPAFGCAVSELATRPPAPEDAGTVERETYRQMHDIATNDLGCASILEALEEIDRFRKALTTIADGVLDARGNKRPLLAKFSQTLALAALSRLDGEG